MHLIKCAAKRVWYGGVLPSRKSRFHTGKGQFAVGSLGDMRDCGVAIGTGMARLIVGFRRVQPWITFPAFRFIQPLLTSASRVFEWGSGMSTLWFEQNVGEVYGVEDNPAWHEQLSSRTIKAQICMAVGSAYVNKIRAFEHGYFDLISIDGSHRLACFKLALEYSRRGAVLLVDNTDSDQMTGGELRLINELLDEMGPDWEVRRFPGWGPGNFFAWETTVCVRR